MSTSMSEISTSSKKRKHEDDGKKSKKKLKQANDDVVEVVANGVGEAVKSSKKGKKDKRKNAKEDSIETPIDTPVKKSRKEKRKAAEEDAEPDAVEEVDVAANDDVDMEDAAVDDDADEHFQDAVEEVTEDIDSDQLDSTDDTAFHSSRMSLYVPLNPSGTTKALSSLLAIHIGPLLLTYFPPAGGVILGYSDPVLSAIPQSGPTRPLLAPSDSFPNEESEGEVGSKLGDEFAASWSWLTLTFLVFKPQPGEELQGYTNAQSEGFIGLVSYNYFQSSISKTRIPRTWSWNGPVREKKKWRKGKLNDSQATLVSQILDDRDDDIDDFAGHFLDEHGDRAADKLKFRVVDLEIISAQERGQRFALQIEGTLLDEDAEREVRDEERRKWESRKSKAKARPGSRASTPLMSGALSSRAGSRAPSVISD